MVWGDVKLPVFIAARPSLGMAGGRECMWEGAHWAGAHWAGAKMLCGLTDTFLRGSHWLCLACIVQLSPTLLLPNTVFCFLEGGRRSQWVRNWAVWRYFRDYFPIQVKTWCVVLWRTGTDESMNSDSVELNCLGSPTLSICPCSTGSMPEWGSF